MNIEDISIDTYISMPENEKIKFYRLILDELPKANITTQYATAEKIAPQARLPQFLQTQKNGKLTFIAPLRRTDKKITSLFFLCVCNCGNWVILEGKAYRQNRQTSCNKCSSNRGKFVKDVKGLIFGQLKAIEVSDRRYKDGSVYWLCECIDCGHRQEVMSQNLWRNNGHLCEICGSSSKGEYLVAQLLNQHQIPFQREFKFKNCVYPFSKKMAKFDFYVNNEYIIEIDGEHHFKPIRYGTSITPEKAKENFIQQQYRDNYKNYFCFQNNIPIIRIPYTHLNKIKKLNLEDLLPESSQFLLVKED